jgi:hypothetical protein
VVGCTTGSREVAGGRKPVIRDDNNDNYGFDHFQNYKISDIAFDVSRIGNEVFSSGRP